MQSKLYKQVLHHLQKPDFNKKVMTDDSFMSSIVNESPKEAIIA